KPKSPVCCHFSPLLSQGGYSPFCFIILTMTADPKMAPNVTDIGTGAFFDVGGAVLFGGVAT
ncbi:MAG: hypothetical protein LUQ50_02385, partial [Methanospirillum sp.]|uniref:hypothetical protein n=1 Tax=Methanospirillum sp. TaxID=45200 RepID=UPI00237588DF